MSFHPFVFTKHIVAMSRNRRPAVKESVRSSRTEILEKLREECSERFGRDRELIKERIRQEIEKSNFPDIDIDKFVEGFLADYHDDDINDTPYPSDWVWCPICMRGFIVSPVPGVLVCESCQHFKLGVAEEFTVADLAVLLDNTIRMHSACKQKLSFSITNNVLQVHCSVCSFFRIVI